MVEDGVKAEEGQSFMSTYVTIPTCRQEPASSKEPLTLNKESHTKCVKNVDYGSAKPHTIPKCSSKVLKTVFVLVF